MGKFVWKEPSTPSLLQNESPLAVNEGEVLPCWGPLGQPLNRGTFLSNSVWPEPGVVAEGHRIQSATYGEETKGEEEKLGKSDAQEWEWGRLVERKYSRLFPAFVWQVNTQVMPSVKTVLQQQPHRLFPKLSTWPENMFKMQTTSGGAFKEVPGQSGRKCLVWKLLDIFEVLEDFEESRYLTCSWRLL